ncbi:MAG: M23 family metallopeptidase, partial [Clostridiales bacterium]|nr:M23 family metallopeptidase [Clostridiales bacterium]
EEAAKKTAKATSKATKAVGKAIAEAAKATATAVKDLGAVIAAGGVPAVVVIIVICLLSAIGGTCFGIFLSNDDTTGSKMSMTQAISQLTTDYYTDLESFKNNYQYDSYEVESESGNITIDWKTVLAVYAVKTTTSVDEAYEVATMDNTKYELLKKVLYDMNPKSGQVTQKSIPIVTVTTDENGVSIKKTTYETRKVLTITIGHLSADEICNFYDFNSEQKAMLNELLSSDYDDLWNELINTSGSVILPSGTQVGSGGFVWPVAGDYTITSRFGTRVDPISGAVKTHGGTDIAAAHGTPIVAAADGTVIAATYNAGGYGYYVKIKHNDTYQTLYGHCSALIVSAGQTVKQGQVIAKVGSTGYSTGPHCHFEVIQNGVRVDAMAFYG